MEYWVKEDYNRAEESRNHGETNGDIMEASGPAKAGSHSKHYYLQHHDGSPVSKKEVGKLSFQARSLWASLKEGGRAPRTFGKMSSSAWELFLRMLVSDPGFAFLRWCDDGEWKLREWSSQNYSSWAYNVGLRTRGKRSGLPKTEGDDVLDDSGLIRMSPGSCQQKTDSDADEVLDGRNTEAFSISADDSRDVGISTQGEGEGDPSWKTQPVRRFPSTYSVH